MKGKSVLIGSGAFVLLAGVAVMTGSLTIKNITVAGVLALPTAFVTHLVSDTQATKRINQSEERVNGLEKELKSALSKTASLGDIEIRSQHLSEELNKVRSALNLATAEHQKASELNLYLQQSLNALQADKEASQERIEELQAECEAWEAEFSDRVLREADAKFQQAKKNEIERVFQEHDAITSQAIALFRQLQGWGQKVAHGHQTKREIIQNLARSYNENLLEFGESVKKEHAAYVTQIEVLNERVALLQHQLNGDLLEPEYLAVAYSVEGRIANDIAREIFATLQIPLAVRGYHTKQDGSCDVGYGYSRSMGSTALVEALKRQSEAVAKSLRIYKITSVRKLEIADLIVVTFRREAAVKEDTIKLIAGTPEQFLEYVASHPIRYRLIADPGTGKTPVTAVMVSEILKVGGTRGNTGKGRKIPHTLVTVSCPDVESSQKDADYPLEIFLKYGNTTAAVKSFSDADEDWKYRKCDTNYAQSFFQLWVWDELDNTLNNADDPKAVGEKFKNFLKQAHHTGVGWIVSGQSVMTKQIPGFMDDDRELFTQIIIGTSKIRKYLEKYGKKIISPKVVTQILNNLDALEPYIEEKNSLVTDAARLLRLALILDDKSPKLYFLPNLDSAKFNDGDIEETINRAQLAKRSFLAGTAGNRLERNDSNPGSVNSDLEMTVPSNPTIRGDSQSGQKPHCPHCGAGNLSLLSDGRYRCLDCKKRFVASKIVWR